jgi:hypothetical protein
MVQEHNGPTGQPVKGQNGPTRRRFLIVMGAGGLVAVAGGTAGAIAHFSSSNSVPTPTPSPGRSGVAAPPVGTDAVRYLFTCSTKNGSRLGTLTSLEEVWAAPGYTSVTRCSVRLADPSQRLTATELAVASTGQGRSLSGPAAVAALLAALEVAAGAPATNAESFLTAHGRPAVAAALAAAPDAPIAPLAHGWLARHPR